MSHGLDVEDTLSLVEGSGISQTYFSDLFDHLFAKIPQEFSRKNPRRFPWGFGGDYVVLFGVLVRVSG